MQLTDQENDIWAKAITTFDTDPGVSVAVRQVCDLAKTEFAETMGTIRENPAYNDRLPIEGPIYARYLIAAFAARWAAL